MRFLTYSLLLFVLVISTLSFGCGGETNKNTFSPVSAELGGNIKDNKGEDNQGANPPKGPIERKIIYKADLEIIVDKFEETQKEIAKLVKEYNGYISQSDIRGQVGTPRTGEWTIRVPVNKSEEFRQAILKLGEPKRNSLTSEDVTDQYYDMKARIKNSQKEEQRLLEHLDKDTKDLKDILAVEKELTRVRGEIERMQGSVKLWDKLTSMTTVRVIIHERKSYVPPQSPPFGKTVGRTFSSSVDALVQFGQGLVLFAVAVTPWLPVILVIGVPLWWWIRRVSKDVKPRRTISQDKQTESGG